MASSTYTDRFDRIREQSAYERRIAARGIDAALEPYLAPSPVPAQRQPSPVETRS